MKSNVLGSVIVATLCLAALSVSAQQSNSTAATLTINNETALSGPILAPVPSPGPAFIRVSGEPAMPFLLIMGDLAPGWVQIPGVGSLDLFPTTMTFIANGFVPTSTIDAFAVTAAEDGTSTFATSMPAGLLGPSVAFQAAVMDATAVGGVTLTAATRVNFVASAATGGSGTAGTGIAAVGVGGGTGAALLAEVRAPIDAIGTTTITVLGTVVVDTNASTNIRNLSGGSIAFSALQIGDYVKVEMIFDAANNIWIAHQIRLEIQDPAYDVKVKAAVDATTANSVTLLGVVFTTTSASQINITGGIAALQIGAYVEIKANLTASGYEIVQIHPTNSILGFFNTSLKTRSYVDAVGANSITVLGVTINVGPATRLDNISSISQLTTSDWVEVRANPDQTGQLWATRIKTRNPDNQVRVTGPIETLTSPNFTIAGIQIQTTASTQWQGSFSAGFSSLAIGSRVEVHGTFANGVLTAQEVDND